MLNLKTNTPRNHFQLLDKLTETYTLHNYRGENNTKKRLEVFFCIRFNIIIYTYRRHYVSLQ